MIPSLHRVKDERGTLEETPRMGAKELLPGVRANLVVLIYLEADLLITDILVCKFIGKIKEIQTSIRQLDIYCRIFTFTNVISKTII